MRLQVLEKTGSCYQTVDFLGGPGGGGLRLAAFTGLVRSDSLTILELELHEHTVSTACAAASYLTYSLRRLRPASRSPSRLSLCPLPRPSSSESSSGLHARAMPSSSRPSSAAPL